MFDYHQASLVNLTWTQARVSALGRSVDSAQSRKPGRSLARLRPRRWRCATPSPRLFALWRGVGLPSCGVAGVSRAQPLCHAAPNLDHEACRAWFRPTTVSQAARRKSRSPPCRTRPKRAASRPSVPAKGHPKPQRLAPQVDSPVATYQRLRRARRPAPGARCSVLGAWCSVLGARRSALSAGPPVTGVPRAARRLFVTGSACPRVHARAIASAGTVAFTCV